MSDTAHPIADLSDPLLGWASQTELELAQQLQGAQLVADLNLPSDQLEKITLLYGNFLQHQLRSGSDAAALFQVSPALTMTTLVWSAFQLESHEDFLAYYLGELGLAHEDGGILAPESFAEILLPLIHQAITQFGLLGAQSLPATFDEALAVLCQLAGIIHSELVTVLSLVDSLADHSETLGQLDTLVESLRNGQDATVLARTLQDYPEIGEHLLRAVLVLCDYSVAHPGSWFDRDRSHLDPMLPAMLNESVVAELRERPIGTEDRYNAVGVARREMRPRILWDRSRHKVCLRLPEQRLPRYSDGTWGDVQWRVNIDGTTKSYRTGAEWGDGSGFAQTLDITLEKPVRELAVQDVTNGITWDIPVVPQHDPALIFTLNGNNVSDKASLHHQQLAVLVPQDTRLEDVVSGFEIQANSATYVEGWRGWEIRECDMHEVSSLSCVAAGSNSNFEAVRSVDARQRTAFRAQQPALENLVSASGLRVYNRSLLAEFPPTPSGHTETWYLIISSYAGLDSAGDIIADPEPLEIPAEGGVFEIFDPELYDAPWVGEYLIRLRGPRNESFRHECAIVEGSTIEPVFSGACPSFRIPTSGGLSEVRLRLRAGEKPLYCTPAELQIGHDQSSGSLVVSTDEGDQLPLRYQPASLRFDIPLNGEPAAWRACRTIIRACDIHNEGLLRIRGVQGMKDVRVSVRNQHGSPLKSARLNAEPDGLTFVQDVAVLLGNNQQVPKGRIDIEWTDPGSDRRVSVALVDVVLEEPETISWEDQRIRVAQLLNRPTGVWVWPATAPWMPARAFPVVNGLVELPEVYREAGDLYVQTYAADPLMPQVPPARPAAFATKLAQPGYFSSDEVLGALAAFIAGETEEVPSDATAMPVLWDLLNTGAVPTATMPAIRKVFAAHPRAALTGLASSLVPAAAQPGRIVAAGLVRSTFASGEEFQERTAHRAPWIAALELLGEFRSANAQRQREISKQLIAIAGSGVGEILQTARDVTLDTACIDRSTVAIAGMAPAQQRALLDMFFARANVVPGLLLDESSRLLAVFEAFNKREELIELFSQESVMTAAVTLLRTLRSTDKTMYALSRIRFDKLDGVDTDAKENQWALAPVVSFILALASRMHAHGLITSQKTLDAATPGWAKLADIVPELVTSDLVSADAIIVALLQQREQ